MSEYIVGRMCIKRPYNTFSNKRYVLCFIYLGTTGCEDGYCSIKVIYDTRKIFRCGNKVVLSFDALERTE